MEILNILTTKLDYQQYRQYLTKLPVEASTIVQGLKEYYTTHETVDWVDFSAWFLTVHKPRLKLDQQKIYNKIFDRLNEQHISAETKTTILNNFRAREYGNEIVTMGRELTDSGDLSCLGDILGVVNTAQTELLSSTSIEDYIVTDSVEEIVEEQQKGGLTWRMRCINDAVGPIRRGNFILLAARPETGKTTFLSSEATHMAKQLPEGEHVLWFNNEEEGKRVKSRLIQSALNKNILDIRAYPIECQKDFSRLGGDKIIVIDKADLSVTDVQKVIDRYPPGLLVFDQLWKIYGKGHSHDVTTQIALYQWAREMAKKYAPVMTVHQADVTAEGVDYIGKEALYLSKTAVQGEVDVQLMLGKRNNEVVAMENKRYLNIVKNKLGNPTSQRHGQFVVMIDPERGRYNG